MLITLAGELVLGVQSMYLPQWSVSEAPQNRDGCAADINRTWGRCRMNEVTAKFGASWLFAYLRLREILNTFTYLIDLPKSLLE